MVQVTLERATSGGGQPILRLRHSPLERLCARDVFGFLELARVDAEIAVGSLHQLLEVAEAERVVHRQRADDAEPEALMNEPVESIGASGGDRAPIWLAAKCAQVAGHAGAPVVADGSMLSHRASTQPGFRSLCGGRRKPKPLSSRSTIAV